MKTQLYRWLDHSKKWKYVSTHQSFSCTRLHENTTNLNNQGFDTQLRQALTGHVINCDRSNRGL